MNNKTKITLGLSVLTAGTLAAGATGTLAWFTTNKTATATYNNIKVVGTQGNLGVEIKAVNGDATIANDAEHATSTATGTGAFTSDVSSKDGINFYQPDWTSVSGNGDSVAFNKVNPVSGKSGYFTQYQITITNKASEDAATVDVALKGLTITATDNKGAASTAIANWVRVAVMTDVTEQDGFFKSTGTGNETKVYQNVVAAETSKYIDGTGYEAKAGTIGQVVKTDLAPVQASADLNYKAPNKKWEIAKGGTFTVGVAVWIEGTMSDNQDIAKNGSISVAMTFVSTN